jgi:ribose transport system substrate-binding protein
MMFRSSSRAARTAQVSVIGATAALALLLTACSSGTSNAGSSSAASDPSSNSAVAAKVAKLEKLPSSYPIPSGSISGVSKLQGKTVYYIPLTQQSPQFGVTQTALQEALGKVGMSLQVCNGNATPTDVAACFGQATKANAAAIVTDAVPFVLAANSFNAAVAAGIPVLNTDQTPGGGAPAASSKLGYIKAAGSAQMVAVADWIINDSKGKGNVLINESTDGPSPVAFVEAAQAEFKKECSGCTVTINKISSANFSQIAPSTSAALLKDPGVQYVVSEFDQYLQPTQGGVQQAGKTASIKGVSGAAQLSGLKQLSGKNFLYADVGQASAYQGWADADAVLRMLTGTSGADLPTYTIPIRLFTRDNIGSIKLTDAAQASGEWFGPSSYTKSFLKLWGVN